jgi:hypothetical protein
MFNIYIHIIYIYIVCVFVCVCIYVCMYVCMYVFMYVCVYIYIFIYIYNTYIHTYVHTVRGWWTTRNWSSSTHCLNTAAGRRWTECSAKWSRTAGSTSSCVANSRKGFETPTVPRANSLRRSRRSLRVLWKMRRLISRRWRRMLYVCMCVHLCQCVFLSVCARMCMYACMYIFVQTFMHACTCLPYVCRCVYLYVCMHVHVCTNIRMYMYACRYMRVQTCMHACMHVHAYVYICAL